MSGRSLARARPSCLRATLGATLARIAGGLGLALSMGGCAGAGQLASSAAHAPAPTPVLVSARATDGGTIVVTDLPGWEHDSLDGVARALSRQCALTQPPAPWPALCTQLPQASDLRKWIETHFVARALIRPPIPSPVAAPVRAHPQGDSTGKKPVPEALSRAPPDQAAGGHGTASDNIGLLTGYFEPVLHGSRERTGTHQTPVYGRPADLVRRPNEERLRRQADGRLTAYPARAQIETHGLAQAPVLCWLDDPVDAFFLHIQGSGRVQLPDGRTLYLGFADHNGHRYHAIGRELIRRGELEPEAVTAQAIRTWLQAHPAQSREILHSNPRYIFFRELPARDGKAGPPGALGVALEPERSVAVDPAFVPAGALLYLDSSHPVSGVPLRRTVVAQDRGAAITGAVRADLFWGSGDEAGELAGLTRQPLRLWLLWPRGEALPDSLHRPGA